MYTDNVLDFFAFSEGRVRAGSMEYEYDLKDHLGNVRVTFKHIGGGSILLLQADSYYPFGYKMQGFSYVASGTSENKFTYNGKELEDEFGLDWYHYGLRYYDPVVGRWWVTDPMDEFYSPYTYVGNNPIMLIDPNGMNSDCPESGCPSPLINLITTKFAEIKDAFNSLFSGFGDHLFTKSDELIPNEPKSPNEIDLLRDAGQKLADNAENTYFEPYFSVSGSKVDMYGSYPIYYGMTFTPRQGIYLNYGFDMTASIGNPAIPIGFSAGVFSKRGSMIYPSDIAGGGEMVYRGLGLGVEYGRGMNFTSNGSSYTNVYQYGYTFSSSVYMGRSFGQTTYLGTFRP